MSVPFPVKVELFLDADLTADPSTWVPTDVSTYHLGEVVSRRGRADWQSQAQPSWIVLALNNSDGRFSRLNPLGPYYGQLRKNTPIRYSIDPGTGYVVRATGFVSDWPVSWDPSEAVFWVAVRADGVLRRLGQGVAPAKSVARSTIESVDKFNPGRVIGYWSLEDGTEATYAASGLQDGQPATTSGTVGFARESPPAGATAAPDLTAGRLSFTCKTTAVVNAWSMACFVKCTAACRVLSWTTSTGLTWFIDISPTTVSVTTSTSETTSFSADYTDGEWHALAVTTADSGSDVAFFVLGDTGDNSTPGTVTSATSGRVVGGSVNPVLDADLASVTHLAVNSVNQRDIGDFQLDGEPGINAAVRVANICSANDIFVDIPGYDDFDSALVGPQPTATLLEVLRECEAADSGQIVERRTGELGFDVHTDRENLSVALALNYALGHISEPFKSTDDDRLTRNDVTVNRVDGAVGARVVDEDGPLGVEAVGRYDEGLVLNLYTDDQSVHHAGWRVNLGTVNEYRYPSVNLNLYSAKLAGLRSAIAAVDIGSRITISNLPNKLPRDLVDLIVEGVNERCDGFAWQVEFVCQPYKPYQVITLAATSGDTDATLGHLDWDSCVTAEALDTTETGVDVTTTPLITTTADDFPFDILIGGERMTVTNCTGAGNPQTLTVTRSVNSVVKSHSTSAVVEVHPSSARYLGL